MFFKTKFTLHYFLILGDLFDEGEWSNDAQFKDYVDRFYRLFPIPNETLMYVVAGNHDIGFHNK